MTTTATNTAQAAVNTVNNRLISEAKRRLGRYPSTKAIAAELRGVYKALGYNRNHVSVTAPSASSVRVTAKREDVDLALLDRVATQFEHVSYDECTGEVLCGANTYVFVCDVNGASAAWDSLLKKN